jgi:hypothetical protein
VIEASLAAATKNFSDAVNGFNPPQDAAKLRGALDPDVVLFGIKIGQVEASGINAVITFLTSPAPNGLKGASFVPISAGPGAPIFSPTSFPVEVSGEAVWTDNDGSPKDTIAYKFTFNPANSKINSLWAQHK